MGPQVKPLGEMKTPQQVYQKQLVPTLVKLIGQEFKPRHLVADPIDLPKK
jgi:hypothetical protein